MSYGRKNTGKKDMLMIAWGITVIAAIVVFAVMFSGLPALEAQREAAPDDKLLSDYTADSDDTTAGEKTDNYDTESKDNTLNQENNNDLVNNADDSDSDNDSHDYNDSDDNDVTDDIDENSQNTDKEGKPVIALTFDDGPFPPVTDRVLETLNKYNAEATFFLVGYNIDYYPETCKKIYDYGYEVGNHTNGHKQLTKLSIDEAMQEIDYVTDALNKLIPIGETLIRPPYGDYNDELRENVKAPLICWSVDSEDWKSRDSEKVIERVLGQAQDGAIVLMHDIYESTADSVEVIVPKLIERGYRLVTVSELLREKGIEATAGGVYR